MFAKNIALAIRPDPRAPLEHSQIKRESLYALPLNLGGPLWSSPLTEYGGNDYVISKARP